MVLPVNFHLQHWKVTSSLIYAYIRCMHKWVHVMQGNECNIMSTTLNSLWWITQSILSRVMAKRGGRCTERSNREKKVLNKFNKTKNVLHCIISCFLSTKHQRNTHTDISCNSKLVYFRLTDSSSPSWLWFKSCKTAFMHTVVVVDGYMIVCCTATSGNRRRLRDTTTKTRRHGIESTDRDFDPCPLKECNN